MADEENSVEKDLIIRQENVKAILAFSIPVMVMIMVIVACYKALSAQADLKLLTMIFPAIMLWGGIVYRDLFAKGAEPKRRGGD